MTDLVERLRDVRYRLTNDLPLFSDQVEFLTTEAADEITRLRARVRGLHEQLVMESIDLQKAAVDLLCADAERYRWLRQERYMFREGACVTCDEQAETAALWVKCPNTNDAAEVDAAIDAAIMEQL